MVDTLFRETLELNIEEIRQEIERIEILKKRWEEYLQLNIEILERDKKREA